MITAGDRAFVAALCRSRAGLQVDPQKAYLIESRLAPLARREGYDSAPDFIRALRERDDERASWAAVEALALSETRFFRDPAVFRRLVEVDIPALASAQGRPLRIWCAASGSGQEVYSLAMLLHDSAPSASLADSLELFASDLSERSIEKAKAGLYSQFEAQNGLPARQLVSHFEKRGEAFMLSARIRQMVRWRRVNLLDDLEALGRFDLVLARSALDQATPLARSRILEALHGVLAPGGRLVLGLRDAPGPAFEPVAPEFGVYRAQARRSVAGVL